MKNGLILIFILIFLMLPVRIYAREPMADEAAQLVSHAGDGTPADNRAERLRVFLRSYEPRIQSPLTTEADHIVAVADEYDLDWKLIVAIAGVESTFCQKIPASSNNCWGWGIPTGQKSGMGFATLKDGITAVSKGLRENYINKGAFTIEQIGRIYAASPTWAWKVRFFLNKIENYGENSIPDLEMTI